jgi:hypothetical protein
VEEYCRAAATPLDKAKLGSIHIVSAGMLHPHLNIAKAVLHHFGKADSLDNMLRISQGMTGDARWTA